MRQVYALIFVACALACSSLPYSPEDAGPPVGGSALPPPPGGEGGTTLPAMGGMAGPPGGGAGGMTVNNVGGSDGGHGGAPLAGNGDAGVGGTGAVVAGAGGSAPGTGGQAGTAGQAGGSGGTMVPPKDCQPNAQRCNGNNLETCGFEGHWSDSVACEFGCDPSKVRCRDCAESALRCSGDDLQACGPEGYWGVQATCPLGCHILKLACIECRPEGSTQCSGGTASQICSGGFWSAPMSCGGEQSCSNGACSCPTGEQAFADMCYEAAGFHEPFLFGSSQTAAFLGGFQVTLTRSARVQALGVIATKAGPQVRMALYTDVGGVPKALVAEAGPQVLQVGRNHLPAGNVNLSAGKYWLMALYDVSASPQRDDNFTQWPYRYAALGFNKAFPAELRDNETGLVMTPGYNYYLLIE